MAKDKNEKESHIGLRWRLCLLLVVCLLGVAVIVASIACHILCPRPPKEIIYQVGNTLYRKEIKPQVVTTQAPPKTVTPCSETEASKKGKHGSRTNPDCNPTRRRGTSKTDRRRSRRSLDFLFGGKIWKSNDLSLLDVVRSPR
ncbi:uncharacterized protein [Amphiura filiformis]|uniref:uncharacterized protein n=1 Tax=Amphiura filiformis TaxID=82378 RepID=UPI003B226A3E